MEKEKKTVKKIDESLKHKSGFMAILKKVLGITTDILIYPIVIFSIVTSFVMMSSKQNNKVYSIAGFSVVKVLSGSMIAGGFDVGDIVVIKSLKTDNLRVGDIIAFYNYKDEKDPYYKDLLLVQDKEHAYNPPTVTSAESVCGTKTKKDAVDAKREVIFHRIIAIYQAEDGTKFFETKGDSNADSDVNSNTFGYYIKESFVVGRDIGTPKWVMNAFDFCASQKGMIVLVIVPLAILIFFQLIELFTIINALMIEKSVLSLEIRYDSPDSLKNKVGYEMRESDKIYFYDIVKDNEKERVKDFLWGNIYNSKLKKDEQLLQEVNASLEVYKQSRDSYWLYYVRNAKTKRKKERLLKLQNNANRIKLGTEVNPFELLKQQTQKTSPPNPENKTQRPPMPPPRKQ